MKRLKQCKWLFLTVSLLVFGLFLSRTEQANATSLQVTIDYDKFISTNRLEIKLAVDSSSELTMFKYANARVAKSLYFKDYEDNGIEIVQNEAGEYSFYVTENGYVSRGVCETENGILKSVTERTKILDCKYTEDDETWVELPPDCIVSMNMWGFTPDVFTYIENDLKEFFAEKINMPKVEYYLPTIVSNVINRGQKDVAVLVADDRWYGVTYKEDKEGVVTALAEKIDNGEYEGF